MTTILLPATQVEAPAGPWAAANPRSYRTADGVGYTADLRRGGVTVAQLIQEGNGGGTWARFTDRGAAAEFEAWTALWTGTWGASPDDEGFTYDSESVLDALFEEADAVKRYKAASRRAGVGRHPVWVTA